MSRPTAIDLFSGCGGLTLGLRRAGFQVIGAVDNDPLSVETYRANHKEVHVWETDIRRLKVSQVMHVLHLKRGQLDLLAGCPPCQGFSTMRTLNRCRAARDPRNSLIIDFLRFVRVLRPKVVMLENVPGLANDRRFKAFCVKVRALGYQFEHRILNAADYGVPQRRRRLILLASRVGPLAFARANKKPRTVRDAIGWLPSPLKSKDLLHKVEEKRSERVRDLIRRIPKNGGSRAQLGKRRQLACHRRCDGFKDVYGRMAWNDVAPTITSGCINPSKGRFLHPSQNRAITLREAVLLQSFPKEYYISLNRGKYPAAALIGNALPPSLIAALARPIRTMLRKGRR
jgi:DNA (cytosine-5)-methyltransferase 1